MSNVVRVPITEEQLKRARSLYDFGALRGSITKGESNLYGALGEVIVNDYCTETGRNVIQENTPDYDMKINGNKFDVKTKKTTVPPIQSYNCSVAAFHVTQKCSHYVFVRVNENLKEGWILGYIGKEEFYKKASFHRKGQPDPKFPAWKFKSDCYDIEVSKLKTIKPE